MLMLKLLTSSLNKRKILLLLELSRAPVGSSAMSTLGLFIKALAIAVLCFSPPERFTIFLFINQTYC